MRKAAGTASRPRPNSIPNAGTIAGADRRGLVQAGPIPGEAAILVRYMGLVTVCRVTIPRPRRAVSPVRPKTTSSTATSGTSWPVSAFLPADPPRRPYSFAGSISTLSAPCLLRDEARAFLADKDARKREKLIDHLLNRPEYADLLGDALGRSPALWTRTPVTPEGAVAMTRWLRRQFAANRPYDAMVRDILTVQGSTLAEGPAAFYKVLTLPNWPDDPSARCFSACASSAPSAIITPRKKWGQDDYYALAGLFSGVQHKPLPGGAEAIVARGRCRPESSAHGQTRASQAARGSSRVTDNDPRPSAHTRRLD